jgi:hypothetical protein
VLDLHGADAVEGPHLVHVRSVVGTAERGIVVVFVFGNELFVLGVDGRIVDVVLVAAGAVALVHAARVQKKTGDVSTYGALDLVGTPGRGLARVQITSVHGDAKGRLRPTVGKHGHPCETRRGGKNLALKEAVARDLTGFA